MKKVFSFFWTVVILGLLIYLLKDINFYEVYLLLEKANLSWFFLAFACSFLTFVVWNYRCMYILKGYIKPKFWFFLKVLFAGSFFNTVTPGAGIGGEPFRAHYLSLKYKKPRSKILGYILGDTFFRLIVLFGFILFSVLFIFVYVKISNNLKYLLEGILIFVLVISFSVLYLILKKLRFNIGAFFGRLYFFKIIKNKFESKDFFVKYLNSKISNFSKVFRKVVKNKKNFFVGTVLSFVFWMLNFLTAYFLFLSFGHNANFLSVIIVFTLGNIIGSVSPIPGGVGVVESSMTLLYSAMGIASPLALLVAVLQRIIYYFFSLFIGGINLISLRGLSKGDFNKI